MEDTHWIPDLHPSTHPVRISFCQLTAMLEKGDWHQDVQDTTPSPEPEISAGGRAKRKMYLVVDESDGTENDNNVLTTTGVKRQFGALSLSLLSIFAIPSSCTPSI